MIDSADEYVQQKMKLFERSEKASKELKSIQLEVKNKRTWYFLD